jgi:hypothetical protein
LNYGIRIILKYGSLPSRGREKMKKLKKKKKKKRKTRKTREKKCYIKQVPGCVSSR